MIRQRAALDTLADAFRAVRGSRWTTLTIVVTLALGTGLNSAVLALVYGILFRPLPYAHADRLVLLDKEISLADLPAWRAQLQSVEALGAFATGAHVLRGIGPPHVVKAAFVSDGVMELLGVAAPAGRPEDVQGVFVSERTAALANVPAATVLGRPISIAGLTMPVLAVLPPTIGFPADRTDLWIPARAAPAVALKGSEDARRFRLVARSRPGITVQQVSMDASRVSEAIKPSPAGQHQQPVRVQTLREAMYGSSRSLLAAFLAASALVLLASCANVSTLLLGQGAARDHDVAIRLALGAGRGRIRATLFAEGLLLAAAGVTLGTGLAWAATQLIRASAVSGLPRLDAVAVDWHVLAMSLLVGLAVAVACTTAPALFAGRTQVASLVHAHGAGHRAGRRRLTSALVVAQIALSTVLLVAAGLLANSMVRLLAVDIGLDTRQSVAMQVMLADTMRLAGERQPMVATLLDRVRALPGVQQAGIGSGLPPDHGEVEMAIRLVDGARDVTHRMHLIAASSGYLEALGVKLLAGRTLDEQDAVGNTPVVVISRTVARGIFGDRTAVGREMPARGLGTNPHNPRVVGVVEDVHYAGLDAAAGGAIYMPWSQLPLGVVTLAVRTAGDPRQVVPGVRGVLQQLDPDLAVERVRTLDTLAAASVAERRLQIAVGSGFALLTLCLAVLGLVSALMRSVAERRRELAIRAAIGGTPRQIGNMVVWTGARLAGLGLVLGVPAALLVTRLLAHALFGVTPYDPATFAAIAGGILLVALAGCGLPARRAARADPAALLRS